MTLRCPTCGYVQTDDSRGFQLQVADSTGQIVEDTGPLCMPCVIRTMRTLGLLPQLLEVDDHTHLLRTE